MTYAGQCACGAVTVRIEGETLGVRQCWCRQCQSLAAGGPTHNAIFTADDVLIDGVLTHATWRAASGNTLTFHFCPACGTQVFAQSSARPHLKTVRLGVLDQPHDLAPQAIIWTDDAPSWTVFDPALPRFAGQPPVPQKSAPVPKD